MPEELNGLSALVRVLAYDGQVPAALQEANTFNNEQLEKARKSFEEQEVKNPIKEPDADKAKAEAERRARAKADLLVVLELTLNLRTVEALQQGKAYAAAEKLLENAAAAHEEASRSRHGKGCGSPTRSPVPISAWNRAGS